MSFNVSDLKVFFYDAKLLWQNANSIQTFPFPFHKMFCTFLITWGQQFILKIHFCCLILLTLNHSSVPCCTRRTCQQVIIMTPDGCTSCLLSTVTVMSINNQHHQAPEPAIILSTSSTAVSRTNKGGTTSRECWPMFEENYSLKCKCSLRFKDLASLTHFCLELHDTQLYEII